MKTALRQRLGEGAADGQVHGDEAGRGEVGIEAGEQFEVEAAVGGEIERARARELHGAVRGEVSSLPDKVELLDVDRLVGEREANGILIVDLYIFDVEGESGQVAVESPLPGLAEWTAQIERAGDGGMSRELAAEIGAPESVEIELIHLERKVGGIVIAQLNVAADQ